MLVMASIVMKLIAITIDAVFVKCSWFLKKSLNFSTSISFKSFVNFLTFMSYDSVCLELSSRKLYMRDAHNALNNDEKHI